MKSQIIVLSIVLFLSACSTSNNWKEAKVINLGTTTPIGLTYFNELIWIADGDNNRLISIDKEGEVKDVLENFDRPMHIDSDKEMLYIPEYGSDKITQLKSNNRSILSIKDSLDAPAGISIDNDKIAIADFYNHQVLFYDGINWLRIGKKGKGNGEFHYPTDVQITEHNLYIADAYNHRVQIFDLKGSFLKIIGEQDSMNATTGIFVSQTEIFATDFENNRVLIYDLEGNKMQTISDNLDKPTDVLIVDNELYIANYGNKTLNQYKKN